MADPFATSSDLIQDWRPLSESEAAQADRLLEKASALIRSRVPDIDARLEDETLDPLIAEMVACSMVRRAMSAGGGADGIKQQSDTAGQVSQSTTYANPLGALYITKSELRDLRGLPSRGAAAFTIDTDPSAEYEDDGS